MTSLLNDGIKAQVREFFADLDRPVEILFFGSKDGGCEYCQDTLDLLEEVASLHEKISVHAYDLDENKDIASQYRMDKAPGFVILSGSESDLIDYGVRYAGIPAGHEFTSLINDIVLVSKGDSGLAEETRAALRKVNRPVRLQVFVTPTCPYCPRAVVLAHQMAMESPFIEAEMIEAMEFNDLANAYGVSGVPHTVINNGMGEVIGAVPEGHLLQKIQEVLSLKGVAEAS
jgi:glutaredoxin-like protein